MVVGCLCEGDWEGPRCFLFPQNAGRGERCGFLWVQSPSGLVVFLSERSLFFLPGEAFFTPTGKLLSASGQENCCACTMTYSVGKDSVLSVRWHREEVMVSSWERNNNQLSIEP